jgi:putative transposase
VKRLRQLEHENVRLKRLVADRDLELDVMREISRKKMVSAQVRRRQVVYAQERGVSSRRACAPRRRISTDRPRPLVPLQINHVWTYDFVFDACANGQQLSCLTVVDEFSRECLEIDVAGNIRSSRVIEVLARLISVHGAPQYLRSDDGPEFVATALLRWLSSANIETALIEPGKPWQNALGKSFNGKIRDECLSMEWFRNRTDAKIVIEAWRCHYNEIRPHSSLDDLTPAEFKKLRSSTRSETAIVQV